MNIHYKIIEVYPNEHSIVVRYYTDLMTEEKLSTIPNDPNRRDDGSPSRCRTDYNINLPVPTPTGNDLDQFILERAPVSWLMMQESIADPNVDTSLSSLLKLVDVKKTVDVEMIKPNDPAALPEAQEKQIVMTDEDILELLEKAKKGQVL